MTCGIYLISNIVSSLYYIGQSGDIAARWAQHRHLLRGRSKARVNKRLAKSWAKHGEGAFVFSVLEECSEADLTAREAWWLTRYRDVLGLPVANAAGPSDNAMRGQKHSSEALARMSVAQSGRPKSPEHRAAIGAAHVGRVVSKETRELLAAAKKGVPNAYWMKYGNPSQSCEAKARMTGPSNPARSDRARALISESTRKLVVDQESGEEWVSVSACASALGVSIARVSKAISDGTRTRGRLLVNARLRAAAQHFAERAAA